MQDMRGRWMFWRCRIMLCPKKQSPDLIPVDIGLNLFDGALSKLQQPDAEKSEDTSKKQGLDTLIMGLFPSLIYTESAWVERWLFIHVKIAVPSPGYHCVVLPNPIRKGI